MNCDNNGSYRDVTIAPRAQLLVRPYCFTVCSLPRVPYHLPHMPGHTVLHSLACPKSPTVSQAILFYCPQLAPRAQPSARPYCFTVRNLPREPYNLPGHTVLHSVACPKSPTVCQTILFYCPQLAQRALPSARPYCFTLPTLPQEPNCLPDHIVLLSAACPIAKPSTRPYCITVRSLPREPNHLPGHIVLLSTACPESPTICQAILYYCPQLAPRAQPSTRPYCITVHSLPREQNHQPGHIVLLSSACPESLTVCQAILYYCLQLAPRV